MERQPTAIRILAEKYREQALDADRVVEYEDGVRVEPRTILIKTHDVAPDLSGLRAWRFELTKRGALPDRGEPVTWRTLTTYQFLTWAKDQSPERLRNALAERGIKAVGTCTYPLAALLTYAYEEQQARAAGTWPLSPERMMIRERRIRFITRYKDVKGGMSNEEIIVKVNGLVTGASSTTTLKGSAMPKTQDKEETPAQIRARLKAQAETEEAEGEGGESEEQEEDAPPARHRAKSEADAVRGGKKREEKAPAPKGEKSKPTTKPAAEPDEDGGGEEETEEMKKGGAKASSKKNGAKAAKAEKKVKYNGNLQKEYPVGTKIKYVGTRVAKHTGKTGEVTGYRGPDGIALKFSDGTTGSATVGAVTVLKKAAAK